MTLLARSPLSSGSSCAQLSSLAGVPAPRLPKPLPSQVAGLGGPQGCSSVNTQFFTSPASPAPLGDGVGEPCEASALLSPQNQFSMLTSKVREPGQVTGPNVPFSLALPSFEASPHPSS